jgi:hypothetical protein
VTGVAFEHVARVYDEARVVGRELATIVERDLEAGHGVLVCVGEPAARVLSDCVRPHPRLHLFEPSARYTRPVDALDVLWRFSREQLDGGATRVHSIGELSFGGVHDADWHWYEAACNEILATMPITATCLYDTRRCPDEAIAIACSTHGRVEPADAANGIHRAAAPVEFAPPPLPARAPDAVLDALTESRPAREVLRSAPDLDDDVVGRASLVFSELVTNAVRHGGGTARVETWFDDGSVIGRVEDDGPGLADPFATVRLPQMADHGVGLWLSTVEATRLAIAPRTPRGTTATALVAPR